MVRKLSCIFVSLTLLLSLSVAIRADHDPRDSDKPYGVLAFLHWYHDWNAYDFSPKRVEAAAKLMREAGVAFVRMDFSWDDLEPAPGKFTFEKYDRIVEILGRNDIKILGILNYNAVWAAEYWNSKPEPDLFEHYAREIVRHYKHAVKYWEIWNEPDVPEYWRDQDGMKAYSALLKQIYPALKEEDPTCVVLMGGVSKAIVPSLRSLYRHGAGQSFDVVNFHPFVDPAWPDAMGTLRGIYTGVMKTMDEFGDGEKDIWITEIGCPGVRDPEAGLGWWLGRAPNESLQARWVRAVYSEVPRWKGVKKIFWAFFKDTPDYFHNAVDYFGLVRNDLSPKPAYQSYKRAIQSLE